ncbi:radical SAM protein [Mycobacterium kansasii]|uniref:radical SAM protein n=1 Tax=Mycobacterium kansasii TaxID=1768 RepID=UPI0018DE916C|nr:radical SAM protein [Mycobacterium kansasii]
MVDHIDSIRRVIRPQSSMSLTHRCNLRCSYCMPADGLDRMADSDRLTDGEVVRLVGIVVARLGIREVRFTGGEPLLRRGLESTVAQVARLRPRPRISLTTNGIGLHRRTAQLAAAAVNRVSLLRFAGLSRCAATCASAADHRDLGPGTHNPVSA